MTVKEYVSISKPTLKAILEELNISLEESGGCDHSVGICACSLNRVIRTVRIALGELVPCPTCGGTGDVQGKPEYPGTRAWPETCPRCYGECYLEPEQAKE